VPNVLHEHLKLHSLVNSFANAGSKFYGCPFFEWPTSGKPAVVLLVAVPG
jgi:hypothetical protein